MDFYENKVFAYGLLVIAAASSIRVERDPIKLHPLGSWVLPPNTPNYTPIHSPYAYHSALTSQLGTRGGNSQQCIASHRHRTVIVCLRSM